MKNSREFLTFLASSLVIILLMNFFVFKYLGSPRVQKTVKAPSPKILIEKSVVNLYFSQPTITDEKFVTSLILDPKMEKIVAADVVVSYDPGDLKFIEFEPGEVFKNPIILKKEIDQERGRLRFALATQTPTEQQGALANLTFTIKDTDKGPIEIKIVEEESKISAIGEKGNVLGESANLLYYPVSE